MGSEFDTATSGSRIYLSRDGLLISSIDRHENLINTPFIRLLMLKGLQAPYIKPRGTRTTPLISNPPGCFCFLVERPPLCQSAFCWWMQGRNHLHFRSRYKPDTRIKQTDKIYILQEHRQRVSRMFVVSSMRRNVKYLQILV